ncbi:flavodoxin [Tolumonas osonensis]|uniref:Flavodoxin n=1 Tax=Tolumonas osonensis TaxID=675874 RepID=A0A841G6B5_9GAMM|nr:flavodoxin [Tolumonas osonensis]MBB6054684.1 flavodoxin [Tolumonas osonensis]
MKISSYELFTKRIFVFLLMTIFSFHAIADQNNKKRTLVVYFSQPEDVKLDGVDGNSGASLLSKNNQLLGSTQYIAQLIQQQTDGELFRIETVNTYPSQHEPLIRYAEKEKQDNVRPALKSKINNLADYDTVFIGYPIWWYQMPMALYSFLEQHNLQGKTIIPFTTHGGSHFSGSIQEIQRLQPGASVITDGLAISRNDVTDDDIESEVKDWLNDLPAVK